MGDRHTEHRGDRALDDRTRHGDAANGEQLLEMKLEANAEHQEDDADLGELLRHRGVGDETRRVRTDEDAGEQIADDRRKAEALREVSEDECCREPAGECGD
jgi:hypothetical protein